MARRFGHWQLMRAPLLRRKSRALLSLSALALGASLVTALLTVYSGVQQNLSRQFRRYGADLVVTPGGEQTQLPLAAAQAALAPFPDSVGVLYDVAQSRDRPLVIAGADLPRLRSMNSEWQVSGPVPQAGEAWLGSNAARLLQRKPGDSLTVSLNGNLATWRIVGTVQSGTAEDNQLLAPYQQVAALTGRSGYTTLQLRVPATAAAMDAAARRLEASLPGAAATPVRQIAAGEGAVLLSTRSMLLTSTCLILFTVGLCVTAALTTLALERRRDFGLMKALGGSESAIVATFVGEAALLAVAAAAVGIGIGALLAGAMGKALFGLWLSPTWEAGLATVALTVALAGMAALLPWPIIHAATPAAILRGE